MPIYGINRHCHAVEALCIRRTRTDADGRGHLKKKYFYFLFFAYIDLRAQLERDPESDRLGNPPPPPARIMIL